MTDDHLRPRDMPPATPSAAPAGSATSRRAFVHAGAFALLAGPEGLAALARPLSHPAQPTTLKTHAQYLSEAATFDAAIRDVAGATSLAVTTDADLLRFTSLVASAGAGLDHHHSWLVAQCLADVTLMDWTRRVVRDGAAFNAFVSGVNRTPTSLNSIPDLAGLQARLASLAAFKRSLVQQIIAKERQIVGLSAEQAAAAEQAKEAQECQHLWAVVSAVIAVAVITAVAIAISAFTAADSLARTYQGTGADQAHRARQAANQRYQQCVNATASLPLAQRARAIATCQVRWLEEKVVYLV